MYSALFFALLPVLAHFKAFDAPRMIAPCPNGARPLLRPDGEPRKCLPHQNRLCVNALPDRVSLIITVDNPNQCVRIATFTLVLDCIPGDLQINLIIVPNASTVCCYNNQVDYFCCLDATAQQCPDYQHVTVVIHNSFPQNPFALKSYFFRDGIEDEVVDATIGESVGRRVDNGIRQEDGFLVRHNQH